MVVGDDIHASIVVEIAERSATRREDGGQPAAGCRGHLLESRALPISEQ
jgi:hypothetical protein